MAERSLNMLTLHCQDIGYKLAPGEKESDHTITGNTADEVVKKAMEHAKQRHPDMMKQASTPTQMADMEKQMRSKIK
jgi:predicted small metal-binding protein